MVLEALLDRRALLAQTVDGIVDVAPVETDGRRQDVVVIKRKGQVHELLGGSSRVHLIEPVDYESFVYLMDRCQVILTDSGGVQEEAPSLGKTVLVMRDVTERPEAVEAGVSYLVGTNPNRIVSGVLDALIRPPRSGADNPYGDGQASRRIVQGLLDAADHLR
ncbi:MAG: hypothetical protein C0461_03825 [Brevundimonas sp.]|nr:hypothetical protein [Brevundimonas sp.]